MTGPSFRSRHARDLPRHRQHTAGTPGAGMLRSAGLTPSRQDAGRPGRGGFAPPGTPGSPSMQPSPATPGASTTAQKWIICAHRGTENGIYQAHS
jgi:hypothetical protein